VKLFPLLLIIFTVALQAAPKSTVKNLSISNAHLVGKNLGSVYRGSQPVGKEDQLVKIGITDVLIFKNQIKDEVDQEIENLKAAGIKKSQIYHIPFEWKVGADEGEQCRRVISALKILEKIYRTENRSIYFHCTVGEDRTGLLAGLFKQLNDGGTREEIFKNEMCRKGYEAGDSGKPLAVVKQIRSVLTPLYTKISDGIASGQITGENLNPNFCNNIENVTAAKPLLKCK
jgi:hypothetical protein